MSDINAVQIPLYNRLDRTLWFIMCESTFALATPKAIIESVTKYNFGLKKYSVKTWCYWFVYAFENGNNK